MGASDGGGGGFGGVVQFALEDLNLLVAWRRVHIGLCGRLF
jgi:hypothetical protein